MTSIGTDDDSRWIHLLRPRTPEAVSAGIVLLSFTTLAAFMPAQNDTWWHLATGRRIAEVWRVELVDHFSWTAAGQYWPNYQWLSQFVFFETYRIGGIALLAFIGMLLVVITLGLIWQSMTGPPLLRGLLLLCFGPLLVSEWSLRPKLFTLCGMALTLLLLQRRRYVWLPPLFAVWANLHGGVALGVVALIAACSESLLHDRRRLPGVALASAASVLMMSATPLGFALFPDVLLSPTRGDFRYITEWQPAGRELWTFGLFVVAAPLAILTLRFWSNLDDRERLLAYVAAAIFPLALMSSRIVPIFTIAAGPLLSGLVLRLEGALFRSGPPRAIPYTWVPMAAISVAVTAVTVVWYARPPVLGWEPISRPAVAAIRACGRPMYNHYDNGGPLIWFVPEQPVFIDSRQHPYQASFVVEHFDVEDSGNYAPLFARYGFRCAVLPPYSKVSQALTRDGWRVTYKDAAWVVAVRP